MSNKFRKIKIENIIYLFTVVFNLYAIALIFTYNSLFPDIFAYNISVLAIVLFNRNIKVVLNKMNYRQE